MNLRELKLLIDYAINDCQRIIRENPKSVLSEGDFEQLLSDCIAKRIGYVTTAPQANDFTVHTQISHYNNENDKYDAKVDILIAKQNDIKKSWSLNKQYEIYQASESFAIELKYLHAVSKNILKKATEDIDKFKNYYKDDSHYYSIVLLDKNENTINYKKEILKYFKDEKAKLGKKYRNNIYCKVLTKKSE